MRAFFVLVAASFCLAFSVSASAVSPSTIHAVADRPLVVTLADGTTRSVEVVAHDDASLVLVDADGEIHELSYDQVSEVRVDTAAERAQPAQEGAPLAVAGPFARRTIPLPRVYMRLGMSMGFGSTRTVMSFPERENTTTRTGFDVGLHAALGLRISEKLSIHGNFGIRRSFRVTQNYSQFDSSDGPEEQEGLVLRAMNAGAGVTFESGGLLASVSIGAGSARQVQNGDSGEANSLLGTTWGLGGDVLVGYSFPLAREGSVGLGVHLAWMRSLKEEAEEEFGPDMTMGSFSVGPQLYIAY